MKIRMIISAVIVVYLSGCDLNSNWKNDPIPPSGGIMVYNESVSLYNVLADSVIICDTLKPGSLFDRGLEQGMHEIKVTQLATSTPVTIDTVVVIDDTTIIRLRLK